jgi:hypothetical protein
MSNQFFWAVPKWRTNKEVVEYNPRSNAYFRPGFEEIYLEKDFDWISDTPIQMPDIQTKTCANYEADYDEVPE